jgi:tetratricopeptide (TPR) repeat protein
MLHLASCLDESGTRTEAESLMRETLALDRKHLDPNDRQIYSDLFLLAQCLFNGGMLDEAEAAAREVLEFDRRVLDKDHVGRVLAVAFLGHVLMVRGKWDQAEILFKEALDASPSNARYWELFGELNARRGHWQAAAEQYTRVVELDPSEDGNRGSSFLAVALVKTGRYDEYRQHCHRFLERASGTHEFGVADRAAKAALLLPVDGADFDRACQLADFAATATQPASLQRWVRFGKALAEYRRGHFDSAIDWTDRANSSSNERTSPARAGDYFIQACAFGRLRQMESARAALDKGNEFVQQAREQIPVDFYGNWGDWTIADLLRQEAEKLLAEKPAAEAGSQQ